MAHWSKLFFQVWVSFAVADAGYIARNLRTRARAYLRGFLPSQVVDKVALQDLCQIYKLKKKVPLAFRKHRLPKEALEILEKSGIRLQAVQPAGAVQEASTSVGGAASALATGNKNEAGPSNSNEPGPSQDEEPGPSQDDGNSDEDDSNTDEDNSSAEETEESEESEGSSSSDDTDDSGAEDFQAMMDEMSQADREEEQEKRRPTRKCRICGKDYTAATGHHNRPGFLKCPEMVDNSEETRRLLTRARGGGARRASTRAGVSQRPQTATKHESGGRVSLRHEVKAQKVKIQVKEEAVEKKKAAKGGEVRVKQEAGEQKGVATVAKGEVRVKEEAVAPGEIKIDIPGAVRVKQEKPEVCRCSGLLAWDLTF